MMMKTTKLLMAIVVSVIALPAVAQPVPAASDPDCFWQEAQAQKKNPDQIAQDKVTKENVRADARKPGPVAACDVKGQETLAVKKTPEQLAKERADKAKRGTTPEELAKQVAHSPGT